MLTVYAIFMYNLLTLEVTKHFSSQMRASFTRWHLVRKNVKKQEMDLEFIFWRSKICAVEINLSTPSMNINDRLLGEQEAEKELPWSVVGTFKKNGRKNLNDIS